MDNLTDKGRAALEAAAARQGFSPDAARAMLDALVAGRGSQAQFSHPELGGMGQWSMGGMVMIGDMFNNGLKYRVDALANELSPLATDSSAFAAAPAGSVRGGSDWWPEGLGAPSSVGAQNDMRYAVFPGARRLAVDRGGRVTVYDTGDHVIGGASQQQGGGQTLTFSSQFGTVTLDSLREAGEAAPRQQSQFEPQQSQFEPQQSQSQFQAQPEPTPAPQPAAESAPATPWREPKAQAEQPRTSAAPQAAPAGGDPLALLERLADLRAKGILSDEEFSAKKAELLSRL